MKKRKSDLLRARGRAGSAGRPGVGRQPAGAFWLYGLHAARAALSNPRRKVRRALMTERAAAEIGPGALQRVETHIVAPDAILRLLPSGAAHQGIALLCEPLPPLTLQEAISDRPNSEAAHRIVVVLDQITDPHNVGAIMRSCAAFEVAALVLQDRRAPPETGTLAKAASGGLDQVPLVRVVNIARALEELERMGFWRIALASDGAMTLSEAATLSDVALVFGAEGEGLRRLVRARCDSSARIPLVGTMESLNVSNAAAIALYELRRS